MQGIWIIPAVPTRASASIIQGYHLFDYLIVHISFCCEDFKAESAFCGSIQMPLVNCPGVPNSKRQESDEAVRGCCAIRSALTQNSGRKNITSEETKPGAQHWGAP
jgi:hypothetical protein